MLLTGSWLPGWDKYISACQKLDTCIDDVMEAQRAAAAASVSDESSLPSSSAAAAAAAAAAGSSSCRRQKEDLMSFLLKAQQRKQQQQQSSAAGGGGGQIVITDGQIRDEIKTMMFGASDTSGFTLAMLAYHWAQHPEAAEAAAAEVQSLLNNSGRGVSELVAADAGKLPFVSACINETLRISPAGPVITRTAAQVGRGTEGGESLEWEQTNKQKMKVWPHQSS